MAMSEYLEEQLIKVVYNGGTYTSPTEWWVALYNTDPTDAGGATGVITGGAYTTMQFTPTTATSEATGWRIDNTADITFPTATTDWSTINYMAVYDGSDVTTANMLDYGPITTPRTVLTDGIFKILAGELKVSYN